MVRTHPETGRRGLYINVAHTAHFKGMTEKESAPILDYLFHHQVQPEFTCRFSWRVGLLAFWDNPGGAALPGQRLSRLSTGDAPDHAPGRQAGLGKPP